MRDPIAPTKRTRSVLVYSFCQAEDEMPAELQELVAAPVSQHVCVGPRK